MLGSGDDAERPDESAGAHPGAHALAAQTENKGRERSAYGGCKCRRYPYLRLFADIAHLQHARTESLSDYTAPTVLAERNCGKADHLCTAADDCGTTRKTRYTYHGADSGARYRQSQNDSDNNSDNNAHEQRQDR